MSVESVQREHFLNSLISKKFELANIASVIVQPLFGGLFFAAGIIKASEPREFTDAAMFLLPIGDTFATYFLYIVVLSEVVLGAAMLAGLHRRATLLITMLLSLCFIAWTGSMELLNAPVGCGCGTTKIFGLATTNRIASLSISGGMFAISLGSFVGSKQKCQISKEIS